MSNKRAQKNTMNLDQKLAAIHDAASYIGAFNRSTAEWQPMPDGIKDKVYVALQLADGNGDLVVTSVVGQLRYYKVDVKNDKDVYEMNVVATKLDGRDYAKEFETFNKAMAVLFDKSPFHELVPLNAFLRRIRATVIKLDDS